MSVIFFCLGVYVVAKFVEVVWSVYKERNMRHASNKSKRVKAVFDLEENGPLARVSKKAKRYLSIANREMIRGMKRAVEKVVDR